MAKVDISRLIKRLNHIRFETNDPHPWAMAFDGYVAACMHLEAITMAQYIVLVGMSDNAFKHRNQELRK